MKMNNATGNHQQNGQMITEAGWECLTRQRLIVKIIVEDEHKLWNSLLDNNWRSWDEKNVSHSISSIS